MASERLQEEEQFHTKNYLLEMSCFHAKMRLKSAPQKVNILMTKAISKKLYTRLWLQMSLHVPAELRTVRQSHFQ